MRSWAFPTLALPVSGQQPPFPAEWVTAQSALRYLGAMRDEPSWPALEKQLTRRKTDAGDVDVTIDSLMKGGLAMTGMALRSIGVGACEGLSEWGDARAFPSLLAFALDGKNNEDARNHACRALAWVTPVSRAGELAKKIKSLASSRVKQDQFTALCLTGGVSLRPVPGLNAVLMELMTPTTEEHLLEEAVEP